MSVQESLPYAPPIPLANTTSRAEPISKASRKMLLALALGACVPAERMQAEQPHAAESAQNAAERRSDALENRLRDADVHERTAAWRKDVDLLDAPEWEDRCAAQHRLESAFHELLEDVSPLPPDVWHVIDRAHPQNTRTSDAPPRAVSLEQYNRLCDLRSAVRTLALRSPIRIPPAEAPASTIIAACNAQGACIMSNKGYVQELLDRTTLRLERGTNDLANVLQQLHDRTGLRPFFDGAADRWLLGLADHRTRMIAVDRFAIVHEAPIEGIEEHHRLELFSDPVNAVLALEKVSLDGGMDREVIVQSHDHRNPLARAIGNANKKPRMEIRTGGDGDAAAETACVQAWIASGPVTRWIKPDTAEMYAFGQQEILCWAAEDAEGHDALPWRICMHATLMRDVPWLDTAMNTDSLTYQATGRNRIRAFDAKDREMPLEFETCDISYRTVAYSYRCTERPERLLLTCFTQLTLEELRIPLHGQTGTREMLQPYIDVIYREPRD